MYVFLSIYNITTKLTYDVMGLFYLHQLKSPSFLFLCLSISVEYYQLSIVISTSIFRWFTMGRWNHHFEANPLYLVNSSRNKSLKSPWILIPRGIHKIFMNRLDQWRLLQRYFDQTAPYILVTIMPSDWKKSPWSPIEESLWRFPYVDNFSLTARRFCENKNYRDLIKQQKSKHFGWILGRF